MRWTIQVVSLLVLVSLTYLLMVEREEPLAAAPALATEIKPYTQKIPGSDTSFDMVPIPGGEFLMGSPEAEKDRTADEGPQHRVEIKPFWMGKYEVTWEEYDNYRGKPTDEKVEGDKKDEAAKNKGKGEETKRDPDATTHPTNVYIDPYYNFGGGKQPAISMTHHAAMEYCYWLSKKTGKTYRLPTEDDWEYAARAGTKTAPLVGDDPKNLGVYAWLPDNSDEQPDKDCDKQL